VELEELLDGEAAVGAEEELGLGDDVVGAALIARLELRGLRRGRG
jgi:hypothetical protein